MVNILYSQSFEMWLPTDTKAILLQKNSLVGEGEHLSLNLRPPFAT